MVSIKTTMFTRVGDYPMLLAKWDFERNPQTDIERIKRINVYSPGLVHWHCKKHQNHWKAKILEVIAGKDCEHCYRDLLRDQIVGGEHRTPKAMESKKKWTSLHEAYPELALEWHRAKNGSLTPDQVARASGKKVWWQCRKNPGHEWEAAIHNRSSKKAGCPFCAKDKRFSSSLHDAHPEIAAEWHRTKNGSLKPDQVARGSNKKVWWQCSKNPKHEWEAAIFSRSSNKTGCPFCARSKSPSVSLNNVHPEIAAEWHPVKNGSLKPDQVARASGRKVWWRCGNNPEHEWEARVISRSAQKTGCPFCPKDKGLSSLLNTHPKIAAEWHPTKNKGLSPNQVGRSSDKKVWWQCGVNPAHEWETRVGSRTFRNSGCPVCTRITVSLEEAHPEIAAEWHHTKNGSLKPDEFSRGSSKKVWWQCGGNPEHEWEATINSRTSDKARCPFCAKNKRISSTLSNAFPEIAAEWHPTKNKGLSPNQVARASGKKVWWQCGVNPTHEWEARVANRTLRNTGCPFCLKNNRNKKVAKDSKKKTISLHEAHPKLALEWHPTKNQGLTPDQVSRGSGKKVWWRCKSNPNHEWQANIYSRTINKSGCPFCANARKGRKRNSKKLMLEDSYWDDVDWGDTTC